jgi:hypothetical protein
MQRRWEISKGTTAQKRAMARTPTLVESKPLPVPEEGLMKKLIASWMLLSCIVTET